MLRKHDDLRTNKLVVVSKAGFAKEAKEKALRQKVEALTLKEARKHLVPAKLIHRRASIEVLSS